MIVIEMRGGHTMQVRDYRTAVRGIKAGKLTVDVVWRDRRGEVDFAVAFEDGKRVSYCSLTA